MKKIQVAEQQYWFPADQTGCSENRVHLVRCTLSANKMAYVALFHEVVSKATEDLVSSCRRTMIYSDFVFPSPKAKG